MAQPNASRRALGTTLLGAKGFVFLFAIRIPYNGAQYGRASVTKGRHSLCRDAEFVPLAAVSVAICQSPLERLGLSTKRFTEIG